MEKIEINEVLKQVSLISKPKNFGVQEVIKLVKENLKDKEFPSFNNKIEGINNIKYDYYDKNLITIRLQNNPTSNYYKQIVLSKNSCKVETIKEEDINYLNEQKEKYRMEIHEKIVEIAKTTNDFKIQEELFSLENEDINNGLKVNLNLSDKLKEKFELKEEDNSLDFDR
ncbi:hypothetical protein [Aliarcobacter butzleri]|uniref:Uncharacterized protein n=1 Tax=Aliarcobacter butzleri L352 TaxID=1447260 RepID=A0A837J9Q0_9BACT|nr:hypothetical protein [Aliarcobacter butzleri]KLE03624.1 hypothetical protein AF77_09200 [Aliarcobacter butzleri L352]